MQEKTKEILMLSVLVLAVPALIYFLISGVDPDLTNYDKRESIHAIFEKDSKNIRLPDQFTLKNFEKGGKPISHIFDKVTYRTRLSKNEAVIKIEEELQRLSWSFWRKEDDRGRDYYVYCKGKFVADVYLNDYLPENSTDITIYFTAGLASISGADVPKKCLEKLYCWRYL